MSQPRIELRYSAEHRRYGEPINALSRAVATGELVRVRRGAYVPKATWDALRGDRRHLLAVEAAARASRGDPVFSHESAAAVWGIPIVGGWPDSPRVTISPGAGNRSRGAVLRHEAQLGEDEIAVEFGLTVTSPLRTAIDIAATRPFLTGVAALEHVLFAGRAGIPRDDVEAALAVRRPFRGVRRVDAVLAFASDLSGSPAESLSRVRFDELGFAQPTQQKEYRAIDGSCYEVDFHWDEVDVIGETDGRIKYEDPTYLRGRSPQQALWDEKRREDELRAQCAGLVRIYWNDAWNRTPLAAKLDRVGIPRTRRASSVHVRTERA